MTGKSGNETEVGIGLHLFRRFGEASIAAKYHFLCRVDECLRERPMIGAVTNQLFGECVGLDFWLLLLFANETLLWDVPGSKKSPTGPTERTPTPEHLIVQSQLRGPLVRSHSTFDVHGRFGILSMLILLLVPRW